MTLSDKFQWSKERIHAAWAPIWNLAEHIHTTTTLNVTDDPDDNRIVECAVDGEATIIVTGDDHLLRLRNSLQKPPIDRIRFMTPRTFLNERKS